MSDEGKKRRAARYKQYVANKNTTANKNAGEKKSTLRFPRMTAEELNSFGGDNTDVKGYDYANRPIYADEVANHPERKKIFKNIVDKRVVADASEPFAKLDKDGNIVGIPNDNSAPKDVGKVYNNDKTNREKYTRTPLQEGYNREKALEEKKNKLLEEYSTTLKPEIDTEVDDEVINAINEKRFIQDEYNRQKAERERLIAGNNKNPRWYEGWDGLVNTDMIDKANELSWKQIEGYDLDNADQRALAILKLSLPYSRARQSYVNRAKTISDRANQQGKGSMWQGVVDNLADFTGLDEAFSAIEMGKSARHYIQEYERFSKIYNNSDQAREKAIQSLNKEDRANLEVFTAVQQVLAGNENELSNWYKAGQVTGDMLPFMLQLGASSTIVKGAGRLLRGGAKKIAEKQMAKGISTALLNTVVSPATQRAKNEEYANIRLFENRDITAKDRAKVYGQQAIENLTETVGVPFAKLGVQGTQRLFKGIGAKMLEKPMINRTFGKITKFAERPQQWIKIANKLGNNPVSKFLKDNLFFGGFGEEAFEEVEGALGNTVLGYLFDDEEMKQEFSNFWQADNLSVLALGLAPMTMFPLSFGISNAVVSHRDAKAYQQAREQLLGALRQAGLGNKKIIDGLEGKIIEGKPHEVIETLSALRRAAQGAQNEKDIDEAIYNYIAGARRLNEQRNELNAQLQQMNNAQRKEYVDNIIENIHRQQKNNILYQGIKNGYYQELQDPDTGKREKYICEVYNKNGTSIGFITDKEQDDNGNVLFTIVDGLGQVQHMTLDDIYRQAEGGEDANNPIVFTKVRDILDYLYEQAGEDEELKANIQTRNLLQDAIKRGADGSNVINVARLNDGGIMFLTDINEQAGTVTGLVQTQDGVYQPQQISLSEVAEAKEQNVEDLIDNTANIFNANIEADGILPQYTMPYYSSDKQDNNKKEEIKTTPEETEKQRTTEEKESAFTVGDKVAVSVDKGNIDSYGDYGEYDGKEYEVKDVRGNQVILDIDGELRPININKQGVTLTKVENNTEEPGKAEEEKVEEPKAENNEVETKEEKKEEKSKVENKSLTERIKSGEILSQNAEETLVDLYSNMSKEDAQEVVNGIIKQTQDRQKQLAKKTINYEDIDKFQQHKKQVRETEKKLAYWNEVKSLFTAPLSQEKEVQSLKSIKEKESALGQAYSMREYILRNLALGAKFLWNDSENGTKGLGSHLGLREAKEERRNYYAFLNGKDRKAVYPEVYAERLLTDVRENINPNVSFDEVFNEMIDCLSSYSTPTAMMDEAVRMHYEAEDNLTQNDFEKQQQAMIDRAEKREEDRIQDELNKQEALSEEDYERMRQGFDEQRTRPKQSDTVSNGNKRKPDSRTTDGGQSTDDGRRSEETSQRAGSADAERNNEEIKPIGKGVFGNIYDQFRGKVKEAVDFLLKHKEGDLLGVFHREEIGDIDLIWGSDSENQGLDHIIKKHINKLHDFKDVDEAVTIIEDVINNGEMKPIINNTEKVSFEKDGYKVSVKRKVRDNQGEVIGSKNWVVTAFDTTKTQRQKETETLSEKTLTTPPFNQKADGVTLPSNNVSVSAGKDTTVSENEQEKGEKNDKDTLKEDRSVKNITESESKRKGMLGVVLDALRKAIGKENVITDNRQAQRVIDEVNGRVRPEMTEDVFYSNAERSVENISQDKATPEQWLKMIEKQGGLKAGEDKWLGLSDWLKDSKEKTLTKQDVLDFIRSNKIQIEEVEYGDAFFSPDSKINFENDIARARENGESYESVIEAWDEKYDTMLRYAYRHGFFTVDENGKVITNTPILQPINGTRRNYTTAFLKNKKEIAIVVPNIESWNEGDEIHFGDAGNGRAVAWIRFGETTDKDGKRVLVIDEIQSKRHQEGREKGYKKDGTQDAETKAYIKMVEAQASYDSYVSNLAKKYDCERDDIYSYANDAEVAQVEEYMKAVENTDKAYEKAYEENHGIPDAPFEKNWHEVAMKRMLRYAAENGYDKVAWTTGEQQAERYNIGNVVESIIYYDYPARKDKEGRNTKKIVIRSHNNEPMSMRVNNEGLIIDAGSELRGKNLMEVLGKELAAKILNGDGSDITLWDESMDNPAKEINGNGLRIGGEGMKGFYDQMLPRFMDKYGKKWGVKTQDVELPDVEEAGRIMHSVDVTDEMRRSVMEGQPLFQRESSEEVNKRFNEELQQQIDGRLPKDHTYQLGLAGSVLQSAGVRALPIELRASRLTDKSMQENHPFELSDIKNLPNAIQEPIMVFDSANTAGRKVILTEIESKGNNFVVVLSAELKGNKISVNDIRSLYPKDSVQGIIDWINAGNLLKYADKNKALEWIGKQQSNSAEVTNTIKNLDVAAKVLQTFKNPAIIEQKNEKNLKEHRLDHQRGYTSNNGKYFSINAEDAMIDGKFPKIEFCKVYGLKKKVFDFLVDLGIIYTDGEWHHMGKTLQKKVFYWWKDRSRQDYRYDLYDNDIDIPEGSYAHIYSQNKDTIDRLIQDAEGKEWRGTKIPTLEEYIRRKRPAFIEEEWLTEQDKEERSKLHTSISANTKTPARIRYFEHKEVDERYYNIARKKFEEKYKEEDYKKQYLEEYGDKIKQNEKAFGDTESKEHTILNIFKIFAGDKSIEDEEAEINAIRERERLAKEERIRQEERSIKAEESKKKHQELSKKLDKWLQKQVEDGKAIKRVRIQELPEMFVTTDEEMYGRYGWFKARGTYNLPIYYSGIEFTDKRAYNYYTKIKMELNSLEADFYGVKFFKTKNGEAYGFTVGGKVYVDERIADASTPIHEYTHLWAEALRKVNPKEWQNIVSLMKKQTHLWDKVKNDYPELKTDDEIADEVLAHYSGERGKKLLDEEYNKIRGNNKMNIFDKAKMLQAINNVREALRKFWKGVADFLGIHFTSAEEVADKVLSDLLEGVNPNEVKSATDNVGTFDSEDADIRFHKSTERVVEKATDEALEEVKDPILKRAYKGILKESTKDKWASFADDYHALRVMEDKVIEEMRKRDPKFRLHHSVYEQQIAAKAATQGQIFLFSQQTFKPLLDKVDKIAKKYNLSQKEVEQFMMFQFYRERTNDVIYNRWRETQDRIDAGRTPNKEYKEEYDAVKKYMGSLTDRERAEAERKANEIFGKIAEEKTFGSLEEMDEEFDQLKTEMYARAAADKYRQQELWDTNNKDGIRGFAGEESMCRTALYQTIAESYFPKEKGNMTTTRLTPDEIIEKFRDMVGKDNVDELNKLSRAVTQFTLDKALETGNITREEYEKYQRQEYYVPLRGWDKDDGEVSVFGNDTSFQSVNPNAKGRTTTADNPLKYMFVIASNQIHDFNEKQAKRSLINFINEYKDIIIGANATSYWSWNDKDNNKVYDVKRPKKNEYLKGTLEFHVMNDSYERVYPKTLKDYTFTFKDGDKTYNMYLPSKYLVKILNKDKQPDGKIIQWLSKGTRFLASMRTSKNPSFVAANFSRDALVVLLLDENRSKEFPHFRKLFLENLSKMQTVWRSEWEEGKAYRGSKMDNDVQKLYNQWVYYGGMSGYSFFLDDIEKEYEKRYKDLQRSTKSKVGQNVNPFSSRFLDIFNRFSEFTENQVRFAAFRAYLEASEIAGNPLTVQEAVYKSKEATLNFSRSGWGTRTLGKIFPFFNAAMQGIIKLARVLRYNPTRFLGAVSIAVGVGALDAFLSLILGGDDDKKNKYLQINDYVKERNLIIMRAKIPIPQELYIPFTIGVNLMEAYLGKKTVTEAASRIINALGELLPSEVGTSLGALVEYDQVNDRLKMTDHPFNTIISALAPGIVQPIADFNRNRDFMDRPILPKEPKEEGYNKKIAQAGRYDEYKTYKVFQDAAFYYNNLVSIITKHEPISWDREYYETLVGEGNKIAKKNGEIGKLRTVSPQAMQFFFGQYLPAISNIATKVGDIQAGRKALSGENIPIADRLVVKHDKHASLYKKSSLVYDILDEQPNKKTLKKMKKAADDEHKERYDKAIQDRKTKVVERYNKNKDKLTRLRMEVKLLRIQGAVKNEKKIDELLDKQEEIYDKILRDWNKKE